MGRLQPVLPTDPGVSPSQDALRARTLGFTLPFAITPHLTLWRLLGEGGVSRVYEAHDRRLARRVAVKLLGPRDGHGGTARERLLREAELYARIEDPRTPGVYEVSSLGDGTPYVVMEYVVGPSLAELIQNQPPNAALACEITSEILSALCAVHRHGVVHRDVKPSNIILEQVGGGRLRARLVDFGIAKSSSFSDLQLTQTGALLGTPQYMAPEQLSGAEVDARADLYATGLVFYEMLLGTSPHEKSSIGDLVAARMRDDLDVAPLVRAGVPSALCEFLRRALAREPNARFGSADEMQCELHAARAEQHCLWVTSLSSGLPRLAETIRPPEQPSHPPPRVALDASGLHPFADEGELDGTPSSRRRGAVAGLLLGFGLTLGVGIWLLQPQLSGGLHSDGPTRSTRRATELPRVSAAAQEGPLPAARELARQPAAAGAPELASKPGAIAPPEPDDSIAAKRGAVPAPRPGTLAAPRSERLAATPAVPVRPTLQVRRTPKLRQEALREQPVPGVYSSEPRIAPPPAPIADDVQPDPYGVQANPY